MPVEASTSLDDARIRRVRWDLNKIIAATHRRNEASSTTLVDACPGLSTPRRWR
jgi:hypothetical protein